MVSRRAFVAPVMSLFALPLLGCPVHHEAATAVDAGVIDAGVAVLVPLDAGAPPVAPPANVNQVGRFPDESSLNDAIAKIADPNVSARNAVPGGALVATLRIGTPVTQVAKHETFILCVFSDPKNAARNLEGWVAEQAFVPGPTIPSKSACPAGQTRLMIDEQDFCGRVCKSDGDCQGGLTCSGKASLFASGKTGAEVTTCTVPLPGAGASPTPPRSRRPRRSSRECRFNRCREISASPRSSWARTSCATATAREAAARSARSARARRGSRSARRTDLYARRAVVRRNAGSSA